jgi:hypothetical protein
MADLTIRDGAGLPKTRKGRGAWSAEDPGVPEQDVNILVATSIVHDYVSIVDAETEYSKEIPDGCQEIRFQSLGCQQIIYAFATGKVAAQVLPFWVHNPGLPRVIRNIELTDATIYFAGTAGDTILLEFLVRE